MITWDVPMITDLSDDQHEMNRCLVWGTLVGVRSSNWGPIHGIQRSVHGAKRWTHARMSRSTGPRRQEVAAFQRVQWRQRERERERCGMLRGWRPIFRRALCLGEAQARDIVPVSVGVLGRCPAQRMAQPSTRIPNYGHFPTGLTELIRLDLVMQSQYSMRSVRPGLARLDL